MYSMQSSRENVQKEPKAGLPASENSLSTWATLSTQSQLASLKCGPFDPTLETEDQFYRLRDLYWLAVASTGQSKMDEKMFTIDLFMKRWPSFKQYEILVVLCQEMPKVTCNKHG